MSEPDETPDIPDGAVTVGGVAVDTSYATYSSEPEYVALNQEFIEGLELGGRRVERVLDLACGAGAVTRLILESPWVRNAQNNGTFELAALDMSERSLEIARSSLADAIRRGWLRVIEGDANRIPLPNGWADVIVMANAIHCFDDKAALCQEVARVLRPGGMFAFNTSFFVGTFVTGTERFYTEWLKAAVLELRRLDAARQREGCGGVKRRRGEAHVAFSRQWWSAEEYASVLNMCGFRDVSWHQRAVRMTRRSFELVGAYEGLATVLLSGYPTSVAARALSSAVGAGLEAVGAVDIPRNWLEISAARI